MQRYCEYLSRELGSGKVCNKNIQVEIHVFKINCFRESYIYIYRPIYKLYIISILFLLKVLKCIQQMVSMDTVSIVGYLSRYPERTVAS